MRLAATIVSNYRFRDRAANAQRLQLAREIARTASRVSACAVALPAGYLIADEELEARALADELAGLFAHHRLGLLAGVDLVDAATEPKAGRDGQVARGVLPYFVFASTTKGRVEDRWWRQRSTTRSNAERAASRANEQRVVELDGRTIGLLACGEVFSAPVRKALPVGVHAAVVDLGHASMGRGLQAVLPALARRTATCVIHAQHVSQWTVCPRKWRARPRSRSEPFQTGADAWLGTRSNARDAGGLWAELVVHDVA